MVRSPIWTRLCGVFFQPDRLQETLCYATDVCGRYTVSNPKKVLSEVLEGDDCQQMDPRYNVAPNQRAPVVVSEPNGTRHVLKMTWGFIPQELSNDGRGRPVINARGETAAEKPLFRDSVRSMRCVVAADGFYEWQRIDGSKQPYLVRLIGGTPFGFAGLWNRRQTLSGQTLETFTILTTTANRLIAPLHDRMPIILGRRDRRFWLDSPSGPGILADLLEPFPAEKMETFAVSNCVNDPRHERPECLERISIQSRRSLF